MISDSITNASATAAPSSRDSVRKKRTNRSAKLKQSKLGLRREQWLSQVAMSNKGDKEKTDSIQKTEKVEQCREEAEDKIGRHSHESFIESLANSPNSILSGINSITSFSSSCSSGSGSGSGDSCSGNVTEEEDEDDEDCLDDWEAFADALAADEVNHEKENHSPESCEEERESVINQAWRPDDKLRPHGLPNLGKQRSFPVMSLRSSSVEVPSSCPICYEDLDLTDSSFVPCPCGFRLCLFCHKTICDGDGRCPGCRKPYERNISKVETSVRDGGPVIRLARSSSMFCRS